MTAFAALIRREFIEHRGAFLYAPLLLVALIAGATILAFTVGRVDARFSGAVFAVAPMRVYEIGFLGLGFAWGLYLLATLFFYCADGFAADKRNNALLFWKSMPVGDFTVLLSKLAAALSIFPAIIFGVALLSGLLFYGVAVATSAFQGSIAGTLLGNVAGVYVQVALSLLVTLLAGLLWYLPAMALVGSLATVMGRWAIPVTALLPSLISTVEWVTVGGGWLPWNTTVWDYFWYRVNFPVMDGYLGAWIETGASFNASDYITDLLGRLDWLQVAIGAVFALAVLYLASLYRRRANPT